MTKKENDIICLICDRTVQPEYIEGHHTVPKSKKGKKKVDVCCSCGDQIHILFTNKELAKKYNTIEALLSDPRVQKWREWIQKKPNNFGVCIKRKKRR